MTLVLVAIGGFFGSIARFYISQINRPLVGTWIANISGAILLGFVAHLYVTDHFSHSVWLLLGIGFCGAYTTFSTFGHETLQLVLKQQYRAAVLYVVSSFVVSLSLVSLILLLLG